jgi:hypothetical protein
MPIKHKIRIITVPVLESTDGVPAVLSWSLHAGTWPLKCPGYFTLVTDTLVQQAGRNTAPVAFDDKKFITPRAGN